MSKEKNTTTLQKSIQIITDNPQKENLAFNFDAYSNTIAELIATKTNKTPFTIGIYGKWGTGKSTLMNAIKNKLDENENPDFRVCKTVNFCAWKYKDEDEILASLIDEIFKTMANDNTLDYTKQLIEKITKSIDPKNFIKEFSEKLLGGDITTLFKELEHKTKLGFYTIFDRYFDDILWTYLNNSPKIKSSDKTDDTKATLVIFLDDLDRCPKHKIKNILETIKLFMDKEGCIFVIGTADDIIKNALIEGGYKDEKEAEKFLEKIIQLKFTLPPIHEDSFKKYLENEIFSSYDKDNKEIVENHIDLILPALQHNTRRLKEFLNHINFMQALSRNIKDKDGKSQKEIEFKHLLFWKIMEYKNKTLYDHLKDNTSNFQLLNKNLKLYGTNEENEKITKMHLDFFKEKNTLEIIKNFDIDIDDFFRLVHLGEISKTSSSKKHDVSKYSLDDDMVKIKKGTFLYGENKEETQIEAFEIDRYPVTNENYSKFIKEGGYTNDNFWSKEGKKWKEKNSITEPRFWQNKDFNSPQQPVVGVSLYEAQAYAKFANKSLPTQKQWERAARGTDGRVYPWGDVWDEKKCNNANLNIGKTSNVGLFPEGNSFDGCSDMAGNVWEWTQDKNEKGFVLRGGSWNFSGSSDFRCDFRGNWVNASFRDNVIGFRCTRT